MRSSASKCPTTTTDMSHRPRVAILISGRGSNMDAILAQRATLHADFVAVIASRPDAAGLEVAAREHGVPTFVVDAKAHASRDAYDAALDAVLREERVDYVVLAGFMRILTDDFVRQYAGRLVNIHPSLLPAFPGLHAHRQALAHGVRISGCTVHFVEPGDVDGGPIIAQAVVPLYADDTEATLAARIQVEEHRIYPDALRAIFDGRLALKDGIVRAQSRADEITPFPA